MRLAAALALSVVALPVVVLGDKAIDCGRLAAGPYAATAPSIRPLR